ncbi:hypothetical protein AIS09_22250 [Salmonella enterica]|nr:hypothetical protein [Salmonella enterica]EAX2706775.1 hypothetical protein [Salmonella enterica]EIM2850518.1 hypothetical protein [Salmonella enterica]EIP1620392.1 hypothetical protein [Salmonella enterica]EJZ6592836.1 hypothetical protein [Salmonella enterica]
MRKNKNVSVKKLSPELQKRLNRSATVSFFLADNIKKGSAEDIAPLLWMPCILSYIHDDLSSIKTELQKRGLLYKER